VPLEGVETLPERDVLVALGCDLLPGYLMAKPGRPPPMPSAADFTSLGPARQPEREDMCRRPRCGVAPARLPVVDARLG
jgi:hypothetical protein